MSAHEPVNILLVDDTPGKLMSYEVILQELGENLIKVSSAKAALVELLKNDVALILTDVCMPDLDGFEFAALLRQHPRCERTAVIFISAVHLSDVDYVRGYNCGAVDYVTVPVVPEILRAKVKIFVELYRKTKELEELNNALEERVAHRTKELEASGAKLRESEQRLRLASQAAAFGTYDYEIDADRIHWSSEPMPLTEAGKSAPLSLKDLLKLVHPDDRDAVRSSMQDPIRSNEERHELEFRTIQPDGGTRWVLNRGQALRHRAVDYDKPIRVLGTMLDITHRKSAEAHQALLMAELDHRVKNILANVLAIASLSSNNASSVPSFVNALQGRIQSMATAHDLLRRNNWRGADFHSLASEALKPFLSAEGNVQISGPPAHLNPKAAQSVALVFHELATNAVKHGALSQPSGRVSITTQAASRPGKFRFTWRETGGPPAKTPSKRGFGLTAMRAAAQEADAQAEIAFEPEGLVYSLECSLVSLEDLSGKPQRQTNANARPQAASTPIRTETRRCRILVVEDEPLVATELQATLESEGHEVIGPAGNLAQGLVLAQSEAVDLAFLDISLGDETSVPIARKLAAMGTPFTFVTGYSDPGALPPELQDAPRIGKPYTIEQLRRTIALAADRPPGTLRASA